MKNHPLEPGHGVLEITAELVDVPQPPDGAPAASDLDAVGLRSSSQLAARWAASSSRIRAFRGPLARTGPTARSMQSTNTS